MAIRRVVQLVFKALYKSNFHDSKKKSYPADTGTDVPLL